MKRSDYYDRSYDFSEIEDDPRLRNAAKEMHITFWAYAAYVFVTLTVTYLTAHYFAPNEVFLGGIPAYLFVLCVCAVVGMLVMVTLARFLFSDDSLEDEEPGI